MDLSKNTPENIEYMVSQIVARMKMVNVDAVKSDSVNSEGYEDLRDLYEMVMKRDSFTPSEMQALAEEIGRLRKA